MFITVQPHEAQDYQELIHQFYCLRKRTFHDQLGCDVPVDGDIEREHDILVMVNRVRADYRAPVMLHQEIEVASAVLKSGATQVWWRSQIFAGGCLSANIDVATACFHKPSGQTVAMPPDLADRVAQLTRMEE